MDSGRIDYYQILGVPRGSTTSEIKSRYQELAKKYHPDSGGDNSLMVLINRAYRVLSDPQLRFKYNQLLDKKTLATTSVTPPSPAPPPHFEQVIHNPVQPDPAKRRRHSWTSTLTVTTVVVLAILYLGTNHKPPTTTSTPASNTVVTSPSTSVSSDNSAASNFDSLPDTTLSTPTTSAPVSSYTPPTTTYTPAPVSSPTNCSSSSIGSYDYTNCYGPGGSTNCSTSNIGSYGYTNCYGAGGSSSCTSSTIGSYKYTNCY